MNFFKQPTQFAFLLTAALFMMACANTSAENVSTFGIGMNPSLYSPANAGPTPVATQLANAKRAKQAVFVVVTANGAANTAQALAVARSAQAIYTNAVVVEMNRDDAANAALVAEWRLSSAPVPLILVISSKGQPTGGHSLQQATAENIAALVPSPKLEMVFDAVDKGKYAILALTKKSFADKKAVLSECNKAAALLNNEAVVIEVDMDDPKEKSFLQKLRVNPSAAQSSVTLVINKQGQVAGQSATMPDAAKLASAATTPVKAGCGPGCGPAGCGKQ